MRVLIVDDQPSFRQAARELLEHRGYVVVGEASGAVDAEDAVARLAPAAVLLDVRLGEANGFEVAHTLTRAHPRLAVLLVTADEAHAQRHALAAASGARGIVLKSKLAGVDLTRFWPSPPPDDGRDGRRPGPLRAARRPRDEAGHGRA
jgi:DNA-binding NarL/FixJ family response regulator